MGADPRTASQLPQISRAQTLIPEYAGVTAVTAVAILLASLVISQTVAAAGAAQRNADIARGRIAAANDTLGFAARLGAAAAPTIPGQAAAAIGASIERLRSADSASASPPALSDADRARLAALRSQTVDAAQDMFVAAASILASISPSSGIGQPPAEAVADFAARENAYTDASEAEALFFDEQHARFALAALVEIVAFGVLVFVLAGGGFLMVIVPAHRRLSRSTERAIRSQEQAARIGSEVARHVA